MFFFRACMRAWTILAHGRMNLSLGALSTWGFNMDRHTYDRYARQARQVAANREEYDELMDKLEEICEQEEEQNYETV